MSSKPHGILEDISAEIGYTATCQLVDWFGGVNLHVPTLATEDHPIAKVIGMPAFKRLVSMFDGEGKSERLIWLPFEYQREQNRRDRMIAVLYELGLGSKQIASIAVMSERHVQATRVRVEEMGVLPLILKRAGLVGKISDENAQQNPPPLGNSRQKSQAKPTPSGKSQPKAQAKPRGSKRVKRAVGR